MVYFAESLTGWMAAQAVLRKRRFCSRLGWKGMVGGAAFIGFYSTHMDEARLARGWMDDALLAKLGLGICPWWRL